MLVFPEDIKPIEMPRERCDVCRAPIPPEGPVIHSISTFWREGRKVQSIHTAICERCATRPEGERA